MEEKVEEVKVGDRIYRTYKADYARLEKRQAYKASAFPKVEHIGHALESGAMLPAGVVQYTHFVSIPLILYKNVLESYSELKKAILSDKEIDAALFNPESHIHLTLTMLALPTKDKILAASKALMQAWEKIVAQKLVPLTLRLKGLGVFGKRTDKTNIVYGKVVEDADYEKLVKIADLIIKQMIEMKVCTKDELAHITYYPDHDLYKVNEFHMTILNTKFKARTVPGGKEKQFLFDASGLLRYYGDYEFGAFTMERIELSKIGEYEKETGYYLCEQMVPTSLQPKAAQMNAFTCEVILV
eukprot:TRINITY_DN89239_c0_g1_i1.p2 TRINITY_DN89239_c0_g1~~TRINITY_DN89239_c0_g1_i1.p2  ORF type:complete len:299 (+),score=41.30 TRINITY_DN89239_c0_g1_i1:77-973(+)